MGDRILDSNGVTEVSKLPTREEVLSSISALLVAPSGGLASSFDFNLVGDAVISV